ncbi:hypothetical protein [Sporosarcina sp. NPDC096371]|uniref:hypothetical protein n=1 Tax=Sporosarcina sp. NPDC096371 TaxID=3364530 RepID=UPI003829B661
MLIEESFKNLQIAYPNGIETRAEFAELLARTLKLASIDPAFSFTDQGPNTSLGKAAAAEAVISCAKQSITNVLVRRTVLARITIRLGIKTMMFAFDYTKGF